MTAFVEAQHPRSETGKFTAKAGAPSEISLSPRWTEVWEFEDDWKMFVETANRSHPEYKRARVAPRPRGYGAGDDSLVSSAR